MSKSKIVLCTSYFDASPNLISEAYLVGQTYCAQIIADGVKYIILIQYAKMYIM